MFNIVRSIGITLFAALVLPLVGCSSGPKPAKESSEAVQSLSDTRSAIVSAKAQVNKTVAAMNNLSSGGDLRSNYTKFSDAIAQTQSDAERARKRAEEMRSRAKEYTAKWEKEMESISSPELRASAEQRRTQVRQNFDAVSQAARDAKAAYEPFMQDLTDIQKALALDLTPAGVQAVRPTMDRVNADATTLNSKLDALIAALDRVSAGITPAGTPAR